MLTERNPEPVIGSFHNLLRKKAQQIIRTVRYSVVIESEDLEAAAIEELVSLVRLGKFKYNEAKTPEDNYFMFVHLVELRIHSAMMREKDTHSYPIHVRRGISEKLRQAHEIVSRRKVAPRSVLINVIATRCKATHFEAVHLARVAGLSFVNGLTFHYADGEEGAAVDLDIPVIDESMDKLVTQSIINVLESPFQRAVLTQLYIHDWSLRDIAKQYNLPLGYVLKHHRLALNKLKEELG